MKATQVKAMFWVMAMHFHHLYHVTALEAVWAAVKNPAIEAGDAWVA